MAKKTKSARRRTALCVAAHADDLEFSSSGTIARWIKQGWVLYYLICTDGSKGSDNPEMTHKKLAGIRRREQLAAAKILGVKEVFFLDHQDTELAPDHSLKEEITFYIRKLRPQRVLTMNPTFFYWRERHFINHTDHRAAAEATLDSVFPLARDRLTFPHQAEQGLRPHKVKELYMVSMDEANFVSDITDTWNIKLKALKAHKSQVNERNLKMIEEWGRKIGESEGFRFAECFIRLELP